MTGLIGFWPFTNAWMLLWGVAAVIPVLLHFWNRHRYQDVSWAAMEFLLVAVRNNARRLRIEQVILLLVRVSILVLLAAALANPVVSILPNSPGGMRMEGTTHTVLVIDASYSMDFRAAEETCFARAQAWATRIAEESHEGDAFTLVCMAEPPRVIIGAPAFDAADVAGEIKRLQRADEGADLLATCAEVERILTRVRRRYPRLKRRRVCFFTDLGRTTWGQAETAAGRAAIQRLGKQAKLELFDVGSAAVSNLAVVELAARQVVATVARPVNIEIQLESFGARGFKDVPVTLLADGQQIMTRRVAIPAGGQVSVAATHRFVLPGDHVLEARVDADRLAADNRRWLSLGVRSALQVLCVEGKPGAAANVALALEPGQSSTPRVRPVVRSESALLDENLRQFDCVFMCNVARLGQRQADLLRGYVRGGGGLVIFLGDQVDSDNYNRLLGGKDMEQPLLPARLATPVATGQYQFDPRDYRHPIVAPFRGNEQAGLLTTPVWKYVRLTPSTGAGTATALGFLNGDPAIVTRTVGSGRVILVATAGSEQSVDVNTTPRVPWTALPIWPSFPPLVQEMLKASLAGSASNRNLIVGTPIDATLPAETAAPWVVVTDPAGASQRVAIEAAGDEERCFYAGTNQCGVFRLQWESATAGGRPYAVNVDTRESRVARLDPARLPNQFRTEPRARRAATSPAPTAAAVYRYLLGLVLGLLLLETFLAWFFGKEAFSPA